MDHVLLGTSEMEIIVLVSNDCGMFDLTIMIQFHFHISRYQ